MNSPLTLYEAFLNALRAASAYNKGDAVGPVAVLWTDKERQWEPLLSRFAAELPLLTLGDYEPAAKRGPAIWLRCMVARTLPEANWPQDVVPILYLPGISKQELRAVDECPRQLQPLAELQYRGVLFTQKNGRDWTVEAFLRTADGGLQIEVSTDNATREALPRALSRLADEPLNVLRSEAPLTAAKLNALLNPDSVFSLLRWLNDPAGQKAARDPAEWDAFRAICQQQFEFDPVTEGEVTGGALLGKREGLWQGVWNRFSEAPAKYPNLPDLLRRTRPQKTKDLFYQPSSWPQENEEAEAALRERLTDLKEALPAEARKQIRELEKTHGERRDWVWAELEQAPLACILPALMSLAEITETPMGGITPEDMANAYRIGGWKADAAVLQALGVRGANEDVYAVKCAIASLYTPWLRNAAETFQQVVKSHPWPPPATTVTPRPGRCWLFADGLRYDVGQMLAEELEKRGYTVAQGWQWTALPGVTPTAKPAVSPAAPMLGPGADFNTTVLSDGAKVTIDILRRELGKCGYTILSKDETGTTGGAAWTESGALDTTGHSLGWKLALRVPEEVREIAGRVQGLLDAGWAEVHIVTDHGWLLLPFGLPKADLPEHLTEERKGRCARLKPSATTDQQTVPWRWDKNVLIAVPPGICCYKAGEEYEHGGLSLQECVTPILTVKSSIPTGPVAAIIGLKWVGLRCRIQTAGGSETMKADLRTKPADASTSLVQMFKSVDTDGQASLVVPDDSREGEAAVVVLLDAHGKVLAQQATVVGG